MAVTISAAVGNKPAPNQVTDVNKIIGLLNAIPDSQGGAHGSLDFFIPGMGGSISDVTDAIIFFQNFNFGTADGRVDPGGRTLQHLNAKTNSGTKPPLPKKPGKQKPAGVSISGSVGKQPAANQANDLFKVVKLLRSVPTNQGGPTTEMGELEAAIVLHNSLGPLIDAITRFQNFNFGRADGRVDPGGKTLTLLNQKTNGGTKPPAIPTPGGKTAKQAKTIVQAVGASPAMNLPNDQHVIMNLLHSVPESEGGTKQPVGPIMPGMGDNGLIAAIAHFQTKQFGKSDGRVDPGGITLARLNEKSRG